FLIKESLFEVETAHHLIKLAVNEGYPHHNTRNEIVLQVKHLAALLDYTLKYPFKESIKREMVLAYLFAILNPQLEEKNPKFNRKLCYLVFQEMECFPDMLAVIYESAEPENWYDIAKR